jgi:hypothetical protein
MIEVKKSPLQRILISMDPDYKTLTDETSYGGAQVL